MISDRIGDTSDVVAQFARSIQQVNEDTNDEDGITFTDARDTQSNEPGPEDPTNTS